MEHFALIAVILAGIALLAVVYLALFMPEQPEPTQHDAARKATHWQRWEDRL